MIPIPAHRPTARQLHAGLYMLILLIIAGPDLIAQTSNQVPNAEFRGNTGFAVGNVSGSIPSGWRGFAVGSAVLDLSSTDVAAGALFIGSPPVRVVRLENFDFGAPGDDSGFDHTGTDFSLFGDRSYMGSVYLRSANADNSPQVVNVALPIFDQDGNFTGDQPGSFVATANNNWTRFSGPEFAGTDGFSNLLAFRLIDDGGDNALFIALPQVAGPVLANRLPNPGFEGTDGFVQGTVTGTVPDDWRAFAISGASLDIDTLPLTANAVFPGSPTGIAVDVSVVLGAGNAGFDHEPTQVALTPAGYRFRPQLYMRSANSDSSEQLVIINTPVFDGNGFTGRSPGAFAATLDNQWRLYIGPTFSELPGTTTNLAVAVSDDVGEDSIQIAFPTMLGVDVILADGFE